MANFYNTMATGIELLLSTLPNITLSDSMEDHDNSIIEKWQSQTSSEFVINDINGKHLKVATFRNEPISWAEKDENGSLVGCGIAFVILDILKKQFNFTYEVVVPKEQIELGGTDPWESLVGLVNHSLVDMAAVFLPKEDVFLDKVAFSHDLDVGVWLMMLKRPVASASGTGLLAPFSGFVWCLILLALLLYGPCITYFTRLRNRLVFNEEQYIPLPDSVWFVYGALLKQGSHLEPKASTTRILFTNWWIFIILLSAFYTANLTAFLTLSKFTLDIQTPHDLHRKNYLWISRIGSSVQFAVTNPRDDLYALNGMIASGRARFYNMKTTFDYQPLVDGGAVLVREQVEIDTLMYSDYRQKAAKGVPEADRCTYVIAPNEFMTRLRGFVYPHGSKLKHLFDKALSYVIQSGIIEFLKRENLPRRKICPIDLQSKDRQLRNSDLMMTFVIMVAGLAVALTVFIGEVVSTRYNLIERRTNKMKCKKVKFKKHPRNYGYHDSQPPSYASIFGQSAKIKVTNATKKRIINGREYLLTKAPNGDIRLVPMRTPSAFLYELNFGDSHNN